MLEFQERIEKEVPRDDAARLDQQMLLYWLIRGSRPETVIEIGTHRGNTALYLAHALHDNDWGKLITADPFDYHQKETFAKFPELNKRIQYYQGKAANIDIDIVDFVFVDGFHEYEAVLAEIKHFLPRLSKEAIMVFHDCGQDNELVGVNKAIKEAGINAVWIPMSGKMRLYSNFKDYPVQ